MGVQQLGNQSGKPSLVGSRGHGFEPLGGNVGGHLWCFVRAWHLIVKRNKQIIILQI